MNYRIRVKGHVDSIWQAWFEGLQMTQQQEGTTLLTGTLQDQAALYGVLLKIRQLNLTLLEVQCLSPEAASGSDP
jgi:hypothetical protein